MLLASLGFFLYGLAIEMPLFEWQISKTATDSSHDVPFNSSLSTTKLGNSLVDVLYCGNGTNSEDLKPVVGRSWSEETVERITRNFNRSVFPWLWFLLFLSGIYVWWFAIHHKRPITVALISTVATLIFLCILLDVTRSFYSHVGSSVCLDGAVTFDAKLSKTHYESLLVLFAAILAEAGTINIMLHQISRAIIENKESAKLAVD